MQELTTVEGYKIYVFANAIPKDICEQWIPRFPKHRENHILNDEGLNHEVYDMLCKYIRIPFPVKKYGSQVTFVRLHEPIHRHVDRVYEEETHKVVFYLNNVEKGGTQFLDGDKWLTIEAHQGMIVIFDIRLEHRGQQGQAEKIKYIMGLRLTEEKSL